MPTMSSAEGESAPGCRPHRPRSQTSPNSKADRADEELSGDRGSNGTGRARSASTPSPRFPAGWPDLSPQPIRLPPRAAPARSTCRGPDHRGRRALEVQTDEGAVARCSATPSKPPGRWKSNGCWTPIRNRPTKPSARPWWRHSRHRTAAVCASPPCGPGWRNSARPSRSRPEELYAALNADEAQQKAKLEAVAHGRCTTATFAAARPSSTAQRRRARPAIRSATSAASSART